MVHLPWSLTGYHVDTNWLENVNIILIRPKKSSTPTNNNNNNITATSKYDYEICTLESSQIPFVSDTSKSEERLIPNKRRHFPAATLHEADFSAEWRTILGEELIARFEQEVNDAAQVSILNDAENITRKSALGSQSFGKILGCNIALRICAIRCLFLELGILLYSIKSDSTSSFADVTYWHSEVSHDAFNFVKLFQSKPDLRPQIESLFEWWNWLTPTTVGARPRFDTLFYLCILDSWENPLISSTVQEKRVEWNHLVDLLQGYQMKSYLMSPSQLYELARLSSHPWLQWLREFAAERERRGVQRWIPFIATYKDGTISFLPGDQYYPNEISVLPVKTARMYDKQNLEEMREKCRASGQINRIEHGGYWCKIVLGGNVVYEAGHHAILHDRLPVIRLITHQESRAESGKSNNELAKINAKL